MALPVASHDFFTSPREKKRRISHPLFSFIKSNFDKEVSWNIRIDQKLRFIYIETDVTKSFDAHFCRKLCFSFQLSCPRHFWFLVERALLFLLLLLALWRLICRRSAVATRLRYADAGGGSRRKSASYGPFAIAWSEHRNPPSHSHNRKCATRLPGSPKRDIFGHEQVQGSANWN